MEITLLTSVTDPTRFPVEDAYAMAIRKSLHYVLKVGHLFTHR